MFTGASDTGTELFPRDLHSNSLCAHKPDDARCKAPVWTAGSLGLGALARQVVDGHPLLRDLVFTRAHSGAARRGLRTAVPPIRS
jgi:hypothetical protein